MSKRQADQAELRDQAKSTAYGNGASRHMNEDKNEMGDFEDAWEDEMEDEEIVESAEPEENENEDGKTHKRREKKGRKREFYDINLSSFNQAWMLI